MGQMDANLGVTSSDDDEICFDLTSHTEIVFALNELIRRGEMVTVSFNGGADLVLTTLLSVDREDDTLVFDWGGSESANHKLLKSNRNIFVATPDGIKVKFVAERVYEATYCGKAAFVTDLPEKIVRMQRRDCYRVPTPVARPLMCHLTVKKGEFLTLPIHDVSVGGLGLTLDETTKSLEAGMELPEVRVQLPEHGEIRCAAQVRHITIRDTRAAHPVIHVGLRLENPPHAMQARIQRYIADLERARRNMQPD